MSEQTTNGNVSGEPNLPHMVIYCLLRWPGEETARFLLIDKGSSKSFAATKLRPGEGLYHALVRTMEEDIGLPAGSYFMEEELPMITNAGESHRYAGLPREWRAARAWDAGGGDLWGDGRPAATVAQADECPRGADVAVHDVAGGGLGGGGAAELPFCLLAGSGRAGDGGEGGGDG